jgi:hypothetical protein
MIIHDPPQTLEASLEDDVGLVDLHASRALDLDLHGIWNIPPAFCEGYASEDGDIECFCFEPPA